MHISRQKLAEYISIILGPQIWLPVLMLVILLNSNLTLKQLWILIPSIGLLQVAIPLGYLYLAPKEGLATKWDLPRRQDRYLFFIVAIFCTIASLYIVYLLGTPFLFQMGLIFLGLLVILSLITIYWKISLHASINTAGSILICYIFGLQYIWVFLSIPLVFWARLTLKRHTISQLLAGTILSGLFTIFALLTIN